MKPRETYPPGVPCWVDVSQPDADAGVAFYSGLFGWTFEDVTPDGAPGSYRVAKLDGHDVAAVYSQPDAAERPPTHWNTYVRVKDADATAEAARGAGGSVVVEPFDVPGAGRQAVLADPEGAVLSVWQPDGFEGAQAVNQPGAWVFSDLATRDVKAAESFYFELFGWETATGMGGFEFWRLRGYADFLMRDDPELRKRQAEVGADDAFADCVAAIEPRGEGDPAQWKVTFGVDDADETAAKVRELGGEVLVEPFDAGPVRNVVIRDPQGAVFTGSRFYPERLMAQREEQAASA